MKPVVVVALAALTATACSEGTEPARPDAAVVADASTTDAADPDAPLPDAAAPDAAIPDAAIPDAGIDAPDGGTVTPVGFGATTPTAQFGNLTGGTLYEDACPAGQALTGFTGTLTDAGGFHRRIGALCGKVERVGTAGSYAIQVSAGAALPVRGVLTGSFDWTQSCPANQIISGFIGRSGLLVDQLVWSCVPILVDAQDGTTLSLGAVTVLPAVGGTGGTAFGQTNCPAGQVATVARLRAGDGLDAFGLGCATPSIAP